MTFGYPFHEEAQKHFPGFDYRAPVGDRAVVCDYRHPGNQVGHQQRSFTVYWALKKCGPLDLGLDFGSPKGMTPHCIHVDVFGGGGTHPFYGGGRYLADVARDACDTSIYPDDAFPYVASNHSLEHMAVPGDDGAADLLARWIRKLRGGGLLALVLPDNDHFDVLASDRDHKHAWGHSDFRRRVLDRALELGGARLLEYDTLDNHFSFNALLEKA